MLQTSPKIFLVCSAFFACLFVVTIGTLFIGGVSTITTELIFDHDVFYKENNGWGVQHHLTKFIFMFHFGLAPMYAIKGSRLKKLIASAASMGLVISYFLVGEIGEQVIRIIVNLCNSNTEWFNGYSSETVNDILLSDGVQAIMSGWQALAFFFLIISETPAMLLFDKSKKWSYFVLKFGLYILFTGSGFIATIDKNFGGETFKVGFYAQYCLKLSILFLFMYVDLKRSRKSSVGGIKASYFIIFCYVILQYIPLVLQMRLWDLVVSNVNTLYLFVGLLLIKWI